MNDTIFSNGSGDVTDDIAISLNDEYKVVAGLFSTDINADRVDWLI